MSNPTLSPTIFHEDWWLNAASNGNYSVAEVTNGANGVIGRLPYLLTRRHGMKWAALPTLTHFLGPAVDEGVGGPNKRFINRLEITCELIRKLPAAQFMQVKCHRDVHDVIPFQDQKFRTSVQFTHEINPAAKEVMWENMWHGRQQDITRAEKNLNISSYIDIESYTHFYSANLASQGIRNKIDMATSAKIIQACLAKKRGEILAAQDANGKLMAAIFCAWDETAMYYLMSTRSQEAGNGAVSALVWRAIQDAASRGLIFDLDGLSDSGSIKFFASFGGTVRPRYVATRTSMPLHMAQVLLRSFSDDYWFI